MPDFKIIGWEEQYHQDFIDLSVEWLEKYVSVEPTDLEILYHPYESILNKGGEIFFLLLNQKAVGTVAMIPCGEYSFELAKLAVSPQYQGLKLGNRLMERCISFAKEKDAQKIILYTNHKLLSAITLYRKFGFTDVVLANNKYLESDMKMELNLYGNH